MTNDTDAKVEDTDVKVEDTDKKILTVLANYLTTGIDDLGGVNAVEEFEYQGFDPIHLAKNLLKIAGDQGALLGDMSLLCLISIMRGTNVENIKKRMPENGVKRLTGVVSKYQVKSTNKPGKDDVIMSRIPACFPMVAASVLAKNPSVVRNRKEGLPDFLHFTQAPSLIPRESKDLYSKWEEWAIEFDAVINPGKEKPDKVKQFGGISWGSKVVSNDDRKKFIKKLKEFKEESSK